MEVFTENRIENSIGLENDFENESDICIEENTRNQKKSKV